MSRPEYDFSGWATKNDLRCSDGRTIRHNAFKACDGKRVPLVWNHQHDDSRNVLGHADLVNEDDGVKAYCRFNDTESGQNAKLLVQHGDISALSIFANQLKQMGGDVIHGMIREVSLVLAGANPGAFIDEESIMAHGDGDSCAIIYSGEDEFYMFHSDDEEDEEYENDNDDSENEDDESIEHSDDSDSKETVGDIVATMSDKQKAAMFAVIAQAVEDAKNEDSNEGEKEMKHNAFDENEGYSASNTLSHADIKAIIDDAKKFGSLKDAFIAHAETNGTPGEDYGIGNLEDVLFPDAKYVMDKPEWVKRDMEWVQDVMRGTKHTPFSRIKSMSADITEDAARAKGYIKGTLKKEEVFSLLKRTTTPTTIYKKQKMDRDDVIDITGLDVIAWLKSEMRMMLDEEIARAILIGDGRLNSDDDKINESNIRPIVNDDDFYTIKKTITYPTNATDDQKARTFIRTSIKARKEYKGSGNPILFTTEDMLTDMLLIEDTNQRIVYDSLEKLRTALRVSKIVTVPVMEGFVRVDKTGKKHDVLGIYVNLSDYIVGADKGGQVAMFDDFDIDYNQMKYLIETRCSGALVKPYSAIVMEVDHVEAAG